MSGVRPPTPRLIALSPGTLAAGDCAQFESRLHAAVRAGLPGLLLREAGLGDRRLLELGVLARSLGARWVGVHDRVHLGASGVFDAVHLGFRSLSPALAREQLDDAVALGLSVHESDADALLEPVDYAFFGPVHATPSKVGLLEPVGVEGLRAAVERYSRPLWALGGIDAARASELSELAGLGGIAVRAAVFEAADPGAAVSALRAALGLPPAATSP